MDLGEDEDYFHSGEEDEEGYAGYDEDEDDSYEGQYFGMDAGVDVGNIPTGNRLNDDEISISSPFGMVQGGDPLAMVSRGGNNTIKKKRTAAVAKFGPKKRKRRSACHRWTSEARAAEIVHQFAPDRTSAIFYLFRRIASGGMNKNLRIVPAKRNPPKYSCFFEELGMISDPDNDSHYHVWAWPAPDTPASKFMSTYVGATELEGIELGGATSDDEDAAAAVANKEKPKRGRKRSKDSNSEQEGMYGKARKVEGGAGQPFHRHHLKVEEDRTEESTGEELSSGSAGARRRHVDTATTSMDDTSEIELEIEYDDDDDDEGEFVHRRHSQYHRVERKPTTTKPTTQDRPAGKAASTLVSTATPMLVVSEASNGHHDQQQLIHPPIGDDHLAHLYSDLAAAEHLSLDEVLEHPALFGPDGVGGASAALSNASGFGNPEELMHTLLLQELDLDSVNVDFRKRLTGRSGDESAGNRAWSVYGGVWQGCNEVAVKIYHEERAYHTECHNLWKFNHPNVVRAYGRLYAIPGRDIQGCVVLEKASLGDLHSWLIDNRKYLHDTQFVSHFLEIAKGVAAGMSYLHSSSPALVHGDLKPSNVLLFGNRFELVGTPHYLGLRAKISDLGVSHQLANDSTTTTGRGRDATRSETARTLWQPPEQRSSYAVAHFALGTDVLPFGLILWSFWSKTVSVEQLKRILPLSGTQRPPIPKECPPQWASLIQRCWAHDTRERISYKDVLEELCRIQP